jgi:sulfoxide reductase heme-binding subunit YedZ
VTAAGPHVFWITSRAAGTAALILASTSVCVGLLSSRGGGARKRLGGDLKALHEALSLATLAALAVHGAALLGDHYLHPNLAEISIPFLGAYRPFWTGIGIVGGWGLAVLGLTYYARLRIGTKRWRSLHRLTAAFWALGLLHSLGSGTDAAQFWFLLAVAAPTIPALALLAGRLAGSGASAGTPEPPRRRRTPHPGWEPPLPPLSAREG